MDLASGCFHSGEELAPGEPFFATVGDQPRPVCCLGCKAVAEFIESNDLGAFYRFRSKPGAGMNLRPEETEYRHFDSDDMQTRYVHKANGSG